MLSGNIRTVRPYLMNCIAAAFLALTCAAAQNQNAGQAQGQQQLQTVNVRPDYTLGPEDQVLIKVPQVPELNDRPFRVGADGFVELPIVGRMQASGMTVQAFEKALLERLKEFVRDPQVFVTLAQFRGEPVFFVGAFKSPGIYPLGGRRTLVEMLTTVGGLQPNASRRIRITRRTDYGTLPLPNAQEKKDKRISTVDINLDDLSVNINPEEDIALQPYDIVSVERAERVYVLGDVGKPTSIELGERSSISIAQALTEAGGFSNGAKDSNIRILRLISGTDRRAEIVINAKRVLQGKDRDFPLLPNDVLYIPSAPLSSLLSRGNSLGYILPVVVLAVIRGAF
jgi:polysaccharide export outer membrane protein